MTARTAPILRLALLTLLVAALPGLAPPARATYACEGGSGTGTVLANDNGFRAPFGDNPCAQEPISHLYELCSGMPPNGLWLGPSVCTCASTADRCTNCVDVFTTDVNWCGSPTCGNGGENGLGASYSVPSGSPRDVTFTICYSTVGSVQPLILLRLAGPTVIDEWFTGLTTGQSICVIRTLSLVDYNNWDVQLTLSNATDCITTGSQEIYVGGETENYWLCVGNACPPQRLTPLNSNH